MNDHSWLAWIGNTASMGVILTTLLGYAPAFAAIVAVVWYFIQIYESQTIQRWMNNRLRRRLVKLHSEATHLELVLSEKNDYETKEQMKKLSEVRTEIDYKISSLADKTASAAEAKAEEKANG